MYRAVNKLEKQLRDYSFKGNAELLQLSRSSYGILPFRCPNEVTRDFGFDLEDGENSGQRSRSLRNIT